MDGQVSCCLAAAAADAKSTHFAHPSSGGIVFAPGSKYVGQILELRLSRTIGGLFCAIERERERFQTDYG